MWTFDHPPTAAIQQRYGFAVTTEWLDHLRLSSVRFNDGGSGSFVSADGLVLTNHHVALGQLQKISTQQKNYVAEGFSAGSRSEEMKSTDLELNVLMSYGERDDARRRRDRTRQERADGARCAQGRNRGDRKRKPRSDRASLRRRRLLSGRPVLALSLQEIHDVRLVFAPEQQMAFFGGDPDNFTYPRYDLDFAIFRVYDNGMPLHPEHFLKWNAEGRRRQRAGVRHRSSRLDRSRRHRRRTRDARATCVYPITLQVVKRRINVSVSSPAAAPNWRARPRISPSASRTHSRRRRANTQACSM